MWSGRTSDGLSDVIGAIGRARRVPASNRQSSDNGDPAKWPTVGVVIPTRDRAELLSQCVYGLKEKTDYPQLEIVVVDNGSTAKDACRS